MKRKVSEKLVVTGFSDTKGILRADRKQSRSRYEARGIRLRSDCFALS